jgi:translation elongation factor EF-G
MVEAAAESSEELMDQVPRSPAISERAEIIAGLRAAHHACEIQPMLCGTAFKNKGVQRMLDAVIELAAVTCRHPAGAGRKENGAGYA